MVAGAVSLAAFDMNPRLVSYWSAICFSASALALRMSGVHSGWSILLMKARVTLSVLPVSVQWASNWR